ncbi:hypothetical protein [Nostoc sp.]|uniref:hypothetical protein n=1 Tax=Nostoc sp. TaxID=1180 RepID=UPI002FF6FE43
MAKIAPLKRYLDSDRPQNSELQAWNSERRDYNLECCLRVSNLCVQMIRLQQKVTCIYFLHTKIVL